MTKTYGQFCPVAKAAELFCERWTPLILRNLAGGACRFTDVHRGVPLVSPTLLSRRLKQLEAEGIVARKRSAAGQSWTYHLTEAGRDFIPAIMALGTWGQRWSRRVLEDHEVDLGLLTWTLERTSRPEAFGDRRTIVELTVTDAPENKRRWWFINENGRCELCVEEPGGDIALYLAASLRDLIYIWRGDLPMARALDTGRLEAHGEARARRALPRWFGVSTLAHETSRRADATAA